MAWTSIITHGDTVSTPHGQGTVRRVSEANDTAQVEVDGQLFEVPMEEMTKDTAQPGKEQPAPSAKVGDKVRVIKRNGGAPQVGEVGVVKHVSPHNANHVNVDFPSQASWGGTIGEHVELVKEAFKVGDKVKLVKSQGYSDHDRNLGKTAVVTEVGTNVRVQWDDEGTISTIFGGEKPSPSEALEKLGAEQPTQPEGKEQPMPEKKKATPVKPWNVKKGDRVQTKDGQMKGEVKEVTQRTVKVEFDNGVKQNFEKKDVGHKLDEEQTEKKLPFNPGDKVEVIDSGGVYTGYDTMAKLLGATKWTGGNNLNNGHQGVVVAIDQDPNYKTEKYITLIEKEGKQYMINATGLKLIEPAPQPAQQPETQATESPVTKTGDGLHEIFQLKDYMEKKIDAGIDQELKELRELSKKKQTLEVKVGDKVGEVKGLKHNQLEQLINYAALRLSPLLVGMAGTGKTHAGEQTAQALGLPFYSMSVGAQTSKSDIIGYMDASGNYVKTHFRDAYENGGVFLMDEIDAGNANVLIQVNAALSNGLCAFPDKMVKRHEDFVFIASANTFGNGANRQYVGRNQLDAATLDRFAVIEWFIDDELESSLTTGINGKAWYMAVRAARDYVAEKKIRALISPRATQKGSKLLDIGQDLAEVIHATLLGSVPEDKKADVQQVATSIFEKFASDVPKTLPREVEQPSARELVGDLI